MFRVVAAYLLICFLGVACVSSCSSSRVVFLKFHKTGSESTAHYLRDSGLFNDLAKFWDIRACRGGCFSHPVLMTYAKHGYTGIRNTCLLRTPTDGCRTERLYITTVLREPLERLSSHLFYFKTLYVSRLRSSFRRVSSAQEALQIYNRLHHVPGNITVAEMELLIDTLRLVIPLTPYSNQPTSMTRPYTLILGRHITKPFLPSNETIAEAKRAMRDDLGSIGIMEELPAYFYLLSQHLNIDVKISCNKNITHMSELRQASQLQRNRPKADALFAPEVVDFLRDHLTSETELYKYARELHTQQLAALNHTVDTARAEFDRVCGRV